MQKYIDTNNILEENIPECISLIKQIGEFIFSKKIESKGKKLKQEIELLLKNDNELLDLVSKLINTKNHQEEINYTDLTSIIVEMLDYESRLIGQYRRNKDELLERLKNSSDINV
jgi:argonaute-like protein implicated in RNA metabolism and viral defense